MQLLLIRHARPARTHAQDGPADPPLTDLGQRQAEALAAWLAEENIDALYTSPLRRARETAAPVAAKLGLPAQVEPALQEYDAEASSYIPIEELQAAGDRRWTQLPDDVPGFQRTAVEGVERLVAGHAPTDRLALVCHGGVINVYTAWVMKTGLPMFFLPAYTSISRVLTLDEDRRVIQSLNEAAHLRVAGVPLTEV